MGGFERNMKRSVAKKEERTHEKRANVNARLAPISAGVEVVRFSGLAMDEIDVLSCYEYISLC
jgi:hypothetical protein